MTATTIGPAPRPHAAAGALRAVLERLAELMKRPVDWIAKERRVRRDVRALAALDERQLADIGLRRLDFARMLPAEPQAFTWKESR
jgi:uncharacterized protein YjiS (DUF1127 family)